MNTISTPELRDRLQTGEDLVLVNVLPEEAFRQGHIPGSLNVPVQRAGFVDAVERVAGGRDRTIIVYCASLECQASPTAARMLDEAGFPDVIDYEVGMQGWREHDLPVESGAPAHEHA